MDTATLNKLESAFAMGCTDGEACLLADISTATLYNWQKVNPVFLERKNLLKQNPVAQARQAVMKQVNRGDGDLALKLLERIKKDEFSLRHELTAADGKDFTFTFTEPDV